MQINEAYQPLLESIKRYNVLKGSAGSGKSVAVTQIEIVKALQSKETTLFLRKVGATLRNSVFALIRDVIIEEDLRKGVDYWINKTEMSYEFSNGSRFILAGVDDVEKLKSIAGITRIVIEEATELDEAEFNQIDLRLRGINLTNPSITLMFNPISANHWLCKRFDTNFDPNTTYFLNTTYKDNAFLDQQYIETLENLINIDDNLYRIYVLNEWGIEDPEKLFAKDYNRNKHFGKSFDELFVPGLDVYLSWDFNVQNTCLAIQTYGNKINVLREYHIKGYDLYMLAEIINRDFPGAFWVINGDASGRGQSALTRGNESGYDILKTCFGLAWSQFIVPSVNPSHLNSRLLTNLIFKFMEVNISIECIELDKDCTSVEVDNKGSIDPYKTKHPERSHWLDPLRYHFNAHHADKIKELGLPVGNK